MIVPDLNNSQYRQRLMACEPEVLDEVTAYYLVYVANWVHTYSQLHDFADDVASHTMTAVWRAILKKLVKGGDNPNFSSRMAFEAYVMKTARRRAIQHLVQLKKQQEREEQLNIQEEDEDGEHAKWGEKAAGGKSQSHRASQDAMEGMLTGFRRRSAFDLLKKEDQDIIAQTLGLDARGDPEEGGSPLEFKEYAKLVGKSVAVVERQYYRAVKRWWMTLQSDKV